MDHAISTATIGDQMIPLKPASEYIIVKLDEDKDVATASGIILPAAALAQNKKTCVGTVVAVGPGRRDPNDYSKFIPVDCKEGDRILCAQFIGYPLLQINALDPQVGDGYIVIKHNDILAFFT